MVTRAVGLARRARCGPWVLWFVPGGQGRAPTGVAGPSARLGWVVEEARARRGRGWIGCAWRMLPRWMQRRWSRYLPNAVRRAPVAALGRRAGQGRRRERP